MLRKRRNTLCLPLRELHTSHNCCTISLSGVARWVGIWQSIQCVEATVRGLMSSEKRFRLSGCVSPPIYIPQQHFHYVFCPIYHLLHSRPVRGENILYFTKVVARIKWLSKVLFPFHCELRVQPYKKTVLFLAECGGWVIELFLYVSRLIL
jgi:hypothetical protein